MLTVARDWSLAFDPVRFARAAGIKKPDPWQERVLLSTAPKILLCCSRQSGKSSTVATLAAHTATYRDGSLTLIVSPSGHQSAETLLKVRQVLGAVGWPVPAKAEGVTHLELVSGSRVLALPGKSEGTVRGYSAVDLLLIDEASRVSDDLYHSTSPMLAVSGGRTIALSTPFGTRGWWYDAWVGSEPWERYEVPASMCPRISPEFLEAERRTLGEWFYQQEYGVQFLDSQSAVFRAADIDRMFSKELEPWNL